MTKDDSVPSDKLGILITISEWHIYMAWAQL